MSWRLARSLEQLRTETLTRWPGTTVWTIGDAAHRSRPSDHNPNGSGVVCATDTLGRDIAAAMWDHLLAVRDPRVKYVIFDRQIVSSTVEPWKVRRYDGSNPHADHIHVSVGRGPSGGSSRPDLYDDPAPWGLEEDDMTPDDMYDSIVPGTEESYALHVRHTLIHLRWLRTSGVPAVLEAVDAATQAAEAAASGDTETASARASDAGEIAERVRRELAEALDG